MTDNGEGPKISIHDELKRIAEEVGYVTIDDDQRLHEEYNGMLAKIARECVEADSYLDSPDEMRTRALSRVSELGEREELLIAGATAIRIYSSMGMLPEALLASKRRSLVEAIVIDGFRSTDKVVQYINHAIPGPVLDLEKEDMTTEVIAAVTDLAAY